MILALTILITYLAGSIPSALWIGRIASGIDIRQHGSGNVGATNAWRVLGARWGMLVALVDIAKGFAPVIWLGPIGAADTGIATVTVQIFLGVSAIAGHLYPIFAGFRGGKGVLTALGVFLALLPLEVGIAVLAWAMVFTISHIVSLGSLTASLVFVAVVCARRFLFGVPIPNTLLGVTFILLLLVIYTHRGNIRRLLDGTEHKFSRKD